MRLHLESQFAHLSAQLTACRAELAAAQATFKALHPQSGRPGAGPDYADSLIGAAIGAAVPAIMHGMQTVLTAERLWVGAELLDSPVVGIEDGRIASISTRAAGELPGDTRVLIFPAQRSRPRSLTCIFTEPKATT